MKDANYVPSSQKQTNQVGPVIREENQLEKEICAQKDPTDTVPDPFGSYEAPPVLVSRPRTISNSGPLYEDTEIDDDALPNLETVTASQSKVDEISDLEEKVNNISVGESPDKLGVPDFEELDNGGFIEDNYCKTIFAR